MNRFVTNIMKSAAVCSLFFSGYACALDLSFNPEKDIETLNVTSSQSVLSTLTEFERESNENNHRLFPLETDKNAKQKESTQTEDNNAPTTAIRLDFSDDENEKGWKLTPAIEFSESMVFKDGREAVQLADINNHPKTEEATFDRTLEKLGITHYQINLEAQYIF